MGEPTGIEVYLTRGERRQAWLHAREMRRRSLVRDASHIKPGKEEREYGMERQYLGCLGEMAVAKVRGEPWDKTIDTFKSKRDQGPFEVRTLGQDWYDLFLRQDDDREAPWVLVTAGKRAQGIYTIQGWAWGWEIDALGKPADYGERGLPVVSISREFLRPPEEVITFGLALPNPPRYVPEHQH